MPKNTTKVRANPTHQGKIVVGVPGTGAKGQPGTILGVRVLGHRDTADAGSITLKNDD